MTKSIEVPLAFLTFDSGISVNSAPVTKKTNRRIRSHDLIEYFTISISMEY